MAELAGALHENATKKDLTPASSCDPGLLMTPRKCYKERPDPGLSQMIMDNNSCPVGDFDCYISVDNVNELEFARVVERTIHILNSDSTFVQFKVCGSHKNSQIKISRISGSPPGVDETTYSSSLSSNCAGERFGIVTFFGVEMRIWKFNRSY
jgi:hypothetical protein